MDFRWAIAGKLAVGSLPHNLEDVEMLASRGIRAVLSLHKIDAAVRQMMLERGIEQVNSQITDFSVPSLEMMMFLQAKIAGWIASDKPVLVHCYMGIGRSRTVTCCYLVSTGVSADEAFDMAGFPETSAQQEFVTQYAERFR